VSDRPSEPRDPDPDGGYGAEYPPRDDQFESIFGTRAEEARDWYAREYKPINPEPAWRSLGRKLATPFVAFALLLWKAKFLFVALFKFKLFTVAGSMLVSIGAYTLIWGWKFAVGFVVLLLVHEMGHVFAARMQGLPVSAPMFIPFLGAMITMKQMPASAWKEAQVALGGPLLGSLGAAVAWGIGEAYDSELFVALGFMGFFLNLFNLLPIVPLDGGRAVGALHPAIWFVGLVALGALAYFAPNPIIILILVLGGLELWQRWRHRRAPGVREYYRTTIGQRVAVGVTYLGLAALLVLGMDAAYIDKDFGDV
jgi:Zn-dependent protease